ncbi:hypothetical protein OG194_25505 [Streptomyces sp. NBC_01288]|uniref:hypothetical protein n=1 Tax=Streptomyces sp. NBC_01288 TaxID=2903814 RepID=UPI002E0F27DE|nr:hypothetical protein OG194_25505 [Streptomyces sp. NBC_01288]
MTLTDAEYAYLRSELGETDRSDLDVRHMRLGSVEAVAVEVLRERRAALVVDPLAVTVQGVATVNTAENVKAIERQIAGLTVETSAGSGFVSPVPLLRRPGR